MTPLLLLADAPSYSTGVTVGSMVADVVCGALPLAIGLGKQRLVLALTAFFVCVACGLFLGPVFAAPVGLISAVAISNLPNSRRRY